MKIKMVTVTGVSWKIADCKTRLTKDFTRIIEVSSNTKGFTFQREENQIEEYFIQRGGKNIWDEQQVVQQTVVAVR